MPHTAMSTGTTISLIAILLLAGVLQAIALYLLHGLFHDNDKGIKH